MTITDENLLCPAFRINIEKAFGGFLGNVGSIVTL